MNERLLRRTHAKAFHLGHTMECGQFFRYSRQGDWYYIHSREKFFKVRQKGNTLEFKGVEEGFLRDFFSLDAPLEEILEDIGRDKYIMQVIRLYHGLRLIRQDPWECLLSYMASTASNIPKIRYCLEHLSWACGKKVCLNGVRGYTLPGPKDIKGLRVLREVGLGFRAGYIFEGSRRVDERYFESLKSLPYEEAKRQLMELPGVGEKVADCVLLFSLGFLEAFPVDRWIKRLVEEVYLGGKRMSNKKIGEFARGYFGPYAGYAQQYLYYYARMKTNSL